MARKSKYSYRNSSILRNINNFYTIFIVRFKAVIAIMICSILAVVSSSDNMKKMMNTTNDVIGVLYEFISTPLYWWSDKVSKFRSYDDIVIENKRLKSLNTEQAEKILIISKLERENQKLKDLLYYTDNIKNNYIAARVVSAATDEFGTTFMLNVGARDNVTVGYPILNEYGMIGRVTSVSHNSARVLLVTNNGSKLSVKLFYSNISCIVIGNSENGLLKILYLKPSNDSNTKIMENDLVFTSGEGNVVPYGLYIGKVINLDGEFFIKPFIDYNNIEIVKVLLPEIKSSRSSAG